jgi:hypothetical protein
MSRAVRRAWSAEGANWELLWCAAAVCLLWVFTLGHLALAYVRQTDRQTDTPAVTRR